MAGLFLLFGIFLRVSEKLDDASLGATDDGPVVHHEHRALHELFVFQEDLDHCSRIVHKVLGIESQFLEFGVLSHQVLHRVFESLHDCGEGFFVRRVVDVENDFMINSEIPGDRQGIGGRTSVFVVVNGEHGVGWMELRTGLRI
jgi:hypothetical protein